MAKASAGLLMYRRRDDEIEVFLVHPGGPFWRGREERAWSIPKGEIAASESPLAAARREFEEETGLAPNGPLCPLAPRRQPGGKMVHVWAVEGDCDPDAVRSNYFSMEWPPRSGRMQTFPEVDRAAWFRLQVAKGKLHKGQAAFLDELEAFLSDGAWRNLT